MAGALVLVDAAASARGDAARGTIARPSDPCRVDASAHAEKPGPAVWLPRRDP